MNTSVYALFGLDSKSSPHDILKQCRDKCDQWTLETVTHRLKETMAVEQAVVNAKSVYDAGDTYLKSSASMLLDPSARQCYDAWLDVVITPLPKRKPLQKLGLCGLINKIILSNSQKQCCPVWVTK